MIKEAKSINLSLHFLEQVIVSLREQASHAHRVAQLAKANSILAKDSNAELVTKPPLNKNQRKSTSSSKLIVDSKEAKTNLLKQTSSNFIPYRNSVLTSILRDSLGGNCRSCFILTVTKEREQFEETIATCRFGQRCGEIKVAVSANTEIGLKDQLIELTNKVRNFERHIAQLESQKLLLSTELEVEREIRQLKTELRILNTQEKSLCKSCVQALLASAKESIAELTSNADGLTEEESNTARERSEAVLEKSQENLYASVEAMDKAVLVELSTALGGLVQSMYIERELLKYEESQREKALLEEQELLQAHLEEEARLAQLLKCHSEVSFNGLKLPEEKYSMITNGAIFVKNGWLGKKSTRFVRVSEDLKHLILRPIGGKNSAQLSSLPLGGFER